MELFLNDVRSISSSQFLIQSPFHNPLPSSTWKIICKLFVKLSLGLFIFIPNNYRFLKMMENTISIHMIYHIQNKEEQDL